MRQWPVQDVSDLPTYGFGAVSPIWWGTLGFVALEGTGFALAGGAYLYLRQVNDLWPAGVAPPNHWPGTVMLIVLLASLSPTAFAARPARHAALPTARPWRVVMSVIRFCALAA